MAPGGIRTHDPSKRSALDREATGVGYTTTYVITFVTLSVPLCVQAYISNNMYSVWHNLHLLLFFQTLHVSTKSIIIRRLCLQKLKTQSKNVKFCEILQIIY
jgi:hypothetical protein